MKKINANSLHQALISGAIKVIENKKSLNTINVFPVADGDTGTNLASLMNTLIEESKTGSNPKEVLNNVADAAINGARGNSGIIFAQYLNGMMMSLNNSKEIDLKQLAISLDGGVNYAYKSIANPVEGTMITLMRILADDVNKLKNKADNIIEVLELALVNLRKGLKNTTNQLKVLKQNKVVDSGAKGFLHFVEGIVEYLKTGKVKKYKNGVETIELTHDHNAESINFRYCTEALISGKNLDQNLIKKSVQKLGDSLVIAGNPNKMRLHIHTNKPEVFYAKLREFAKIDQQKVDDMIKQHELATNKKYKIALVTDSIADLPKKFVEDQQIVMVPLNLMIEGSNYYDKLTVTSETFYKMMDKLKVYPTSAQPTLKSMENLFSFLSTYYDEIIAITVSSQMSGTNNVFTQAAAKFNRGKTKIKVIDSKRNSGAEGLIVMETANAIASGKKFSEVIKVAEEAVKKSQIYVSVKTLKYMVRSGRVSKATGLVGKIVNLKPVIGIDANGKGIISDKGLSLKSSLNKIKKHVKEAIKNGGIKKYAIVHANALDRANEYKKIFKDIIGKEPAYVMDISSIVAMSAGIGTVAIAYLEE
jgi:DegV family protein with EDD domain